jgi:hypothetical protein
LLLPCPEPLAAGFAVVVLVSDVHGGVVLLQLDTVGKRFVTFFAILKTIFSKMKISEIFGAPSLTQKCAFCHKLNNRNSNLLNSISLNRKIS